MPIAALVALIAWIYSGVKLDTTSEVFTPGEEISLSGDVVSFSEKESFGQSYVSVNLSDVRTGEGKRLTKAGQTITAQCFHVEQLNIGQRIRVTGKVAYYERASNPGQFDMYLFNRQRGNLFQLKNARVVAKGNKYSHLRTGLYHLRKKGENILATYLSETDATIMKAMIFGNKDELDKDVKELFQRNGIAHILAISGLHISFIGMGLYEMLRRMGLKVKVCALISGILIILYGILVGMPVSAVRAITMFGIFLGAKFIGRTYDMLSAWSFAVCLVLLERPFLIRDVSFQLSFMAVFGVAFFYVSFAKKIVKTPAWASSVMVSLWVFLTTLPILINAYYEVAFYSILLNLVIIPLMSALMIFTFLMLFTWWMIPLARFFAYIPTYILFLYKASCEKLAGMKLSGLSLASRNLGAPSMWKVALYYGLLILAVSWGGQKRPIRRIGRSIMIMAMAVLLMLVRPHRDLSIWMLDVGQGDCMVIQNDNGHVYVIDGGSSSVNSVGEKRIIPFLKYMGVNEVEAIFLTHPDADHMNGIEELVEKGRDENIEINRIIEYEVFAQAADDVSELYLNQLADCRGIEVCGMESGDFIKDGSLIFHIIYPDAGMSVTDTNNASLVMKVEYGDFDMLTTGDVEESGEECMLRKGSDISADVLKVAHHGSSSSSSDEFLAKIRPQVSLISVGDNNSYGHPHKDTLERLDASGSRYVRTDEYGCITVKAKKSGAYKVEIYAKRKYT